SHLIVQQAGANEFLSRLNPFVEAARRISFWNYLRTPRDSAVPPELLETDFPDFDVCMRQAEGSGLPEALPAKAMPASQPDARAFGPSAIEPVSALIPTSGDRPVPVARAILVPPSEPKVKKRLSSAGANAQVAPTAAAPMAERDGDPLEGIVA